jgi:hypothetical protein
MTDESANLTKVAHALESTFNNSVGMVVESTDSNVTCNKNATNTVNSYPINQTYWLENDNGQAMWALQQYNMTKSNAINSTLEHYASTHNLPPNDHIEVFWGLPIPETIYNAKTSRYSQLKVTPFSFREVHESSLTVTLSFSPSDANALL